MSNNPFAQGRPVFSPWDHNVYIESSKKLRRLVFLKGKWLGYKIDVVNLEIATPTAKSIIEELMSIVKRSTPSTVFFVNFQYDGCTGIDLAKLIRSLFPAAMICMITDKASSRFKNEVNNGLITSVFPMKEIFNWRHLLKSKAATGSLISQNEMMEIDSIQSDSTLWEQTEPGETGPDHVYIGEPVPEAKRRKNVVLLGSLSEKATVSWNISSYKFRHEFFNYKNSGSLLLHIDRHKNDHDFIIPRDIDGSTITGADIAKLVKLQTTGSNVFLMTNDESFLTFEFPGAEFVDSIIREDFMPMEMKPFKNPRLRLV